MWGVWRRVHSLGVGSGPCAEVQGCCSVGGGERLERRATFLVPFPRAL